jgi:hypothetical protein
VVVYRACQRDCRKTDFVESLSGPGAHRETSFSRCRRVLLGQGSVERRKRVDFANIVYHGEPRTRPLYIDFEFGPYREGVHALVDTDVGKVLFRTRQHEREIFVILTAERLGGQDHLLPGIDQGLGVVSPDDPVGDGHLYLSTKTG